MVPATLTGLLSQSVTSPLIVLLIIHKAPFSGSASALGKKSSGWRYLIDLLISRACERGHGARITHRLTAGP